LLSLVAVGCGVFTPTVTPTASVTPTPPNTATPTATDTPKPSETPQESSTATPVYVPLYFTRAESDTRPFTSEEVAARTAYAGMHATRTQFVTEHPNAPTYPPEITPTFSPGDFWAATQTVPEIEAQLGFDVLEPGWLPDQLSDFYGASADLEKGIAYQRYDRYALLIIQYPASMDIEPPEIGASARVRIVDINGHTGEYVNGYWEGTENGWVYRTYALPTLRWEQDGMIFQIILYNSINVWTESGPMTILDAMIAIAKSMH